MINDTSFPSTLNETKIHHKVSIVTCFFFFFVSKRHCHTSVSYRWNSDETLFDQITDRSTTDERRLSDRPILTLIDQFTKESFYQQIFSH